MKAALAIVLALPAVVLSARVNTARHEPRRVSDGVVAHASALMRKYTKHSMTDDEVRDVLAQQHELSDAVKAHLANLHSEDRSRNEELRMLRQRAQKGIAAAGLQLDKSVDGKDTTQCRCFIEKVKFADNKLKLIDLDGEGGSGYYCGKQCFRRCKSHHKYKLDPGAEADALGVEIHQAMAVAQCEHGECKCLDATQSHHRIVQANGIIQSLDQFHQGVKIDAVHYPTGQAEFDTEEACLAGCGRSCRDFKGPGGIEVDLEAMCIDEWRSGD